MRLSHSNTYEIVYNRVREADEIQLACEFYGSCHEL